MSANSAAKRVLTLSASEYARVLRVIDSEVLGKTVTLSTVEPGTFLLKGDRQNDLLRASSALKALGLGFTKQEAVTLWDEKNTLTMVPLKAELPPRDVGKKGRSARRRLLGFQALNLRVIQNFTGVSYRIDNDQMWLLGPVDAVVEASRQVRQIVMGRTRGTVQQYHRGKHGITVKRKRHL